MTEPILALSSDTGQYALDTDASDRGLGAVLSERTVDGDERVIAYVSMTLWSPELKYLTGIEGIEAVPAILARATHTYPDGSCSAVVAPSYAGTDVAARPIVDVHRRV